MPWTDIHSHILPGFDDGAGSDEEFLKMAEVAVGGGTALMAATPHYDVEKPAFEPRDVAAAVEEHNGILRSRGIPLALVPGVEVRINAGLYNMAKERSGLEKLRLGGKGRYVLVDFPLVDIPVATSEIFFQVQLCGITPILAHPERNRYLVEHPSMVRDLVERGVEIQVNSGSFEGIYGKSALRMARGLLKEGVARLVASDAHRPRGRSPDLSAAAKALRRQIGKEAVRIVLEVNPGLALEGESLVEATGGPSRRSRSTWIPSWKKAT